MLTNKKYTNLLLFFVTYTELGCPWKEDFELHGKGTRTISIFMDYLTSNFVHSGI